MVLSKIEQAVSYRQKAYEEIKNAIISQKFKPATQLLERQLAEQLGVSRTPVREALALLEQEGWVETIPWKGTYVLSLSIQDVEEVFHLRLALEPLAVELADNFIEWKHLEELDNLLLKQEAEITGDPQMYINYDRDFHCYLAKLSCNKRLIAILENLSDMMRRMGIQANMKPGRALESFMEHRRLLDALSRRDVKTAKAAMAEHVTRTRAAVLELLQTAGSQVQV